MSLFLILNLNPIFLSRALIPHCELSIIEYFTLRPYSFLLSYEIIPIENKD